MSKIAIVAGKEFGDYIRSKAFLLSVALTPVLIGISALAQKAAKDHQDTTQRKVVIIDHTEQLAAPIARAAKAHGLYSITPIPAEASPTFRLNLSDRVRAGDFFAFVEIPADILTPEGSTNQIAYHSGEPTHRELPRWLEQTINREAQSLRVAQSGITPKVQQQVRRLHRETPLARLELFTRSSDDGSITDAKPVNPMRAFIVPVGLVFLLYMTVMITTPQILNSVLEEKMSRISEVLLGSVSAFELLMGKLLGCLGAALIMGSVYLGAALVLAAHHGFLHLLTPGLLAWFGCFLILAILFYGSIFIAIGSACTDLKDAQAAMMPVMVTVMLPMFLLPIVLENPNGTAGLILSFLPPATPMLMTLRLGLEPGPPLWQPILGLALMTGTMLASVWAAGKIFRTGILMQGKAARPSELWRWITAK